MPVIQRFRSFLPEAVGLFLGLTAIVAFLCAETGRDSSSASPFPLPIWSSDSRFTGCLRQYGRIGAETSL